MPIPLSQLEIWSHQGAIATSSRAYASIQHALTKSTSPLANRGVEIFLQGSYGNATNTYGDSDVDVVVLYPNSFFKDMTALTQAQQLLHEASFPPANYRWPELRDDTLAALRSHYGNDAVTVGRKSIKVDACAGGRPSDVLPAMQFRRYATFADPNNLTAHWGVQFFDSSNNAIINYPRYHIQRGEAKNQQARTRGQYKATIRLLKNFRDHLVDSRRLAEGVAPSYYIECALYNVPDSLFVGSFNNTVPAILDYLWTTPYATFLCQNGVVRLIGNGVTQWPEGNYISFIQAARTAWDGR
jgi:hypothetical protein